MSKKTERDESIEDDPYAGQDYGVVPTNERDRGMLDDIKSAAASGKEHVADFAEAAASKASDAVSNVHDRATDLVHTVGQTSTNAQSSASRFFDDNPLAVGVVAFLVGAAVGAALPRTDAENQIMGGARSKLLDKAKEAADDLKHKAKDTATGVIEDVKDQVKNQFVSAS